MNRHLRHAVLAFSVRSRTKKARTIRAFMQEVGVSDVIFVGCSPGSNVNEMIVERSVAQQSRVLAAVDVLACPALEWPFVRADGRSLPFADRQTDFIVAQAVIEHVGGIEDQRRFVQEQSRVGRSWVITTPNRWFPMESHTATVLLHWLPQWRRRRSEFTRLLSLSEFKALLPKGTRVVGSPWSSTFLAFYVAPPATQARQPGGHHVVGKRTN
ncbi:methyltransferase domain-containing protein [Terrabacter sp. Ter38]|uniref:methyltransferase domain-containing protein n=1 Tax=Terrabacter sp. Ter38 TaxID=2926030 RepID=UPI0021181762|nr:methyltransferase domain-containing protein [Terrabacter sp. Ter38]